MYRAIFGSFWRLWSPRPSFLYFVCIFIILYDDLDIPRRVWWAIDHSDTSLCIYCFYFLWLRPAEYLVRFIDGSREHWFFEGVLRNVLVSDDFLQTMGNSSTSIQRDLTSVYSLGCFFGTLSTIRPGNILGRPPAMLVGSTIITLGALI